MIRVLVADDQELVRAGLRALLSNDPGLSVVAEARSGREACAQTLRLRPDVVLMDLRMPDMDGVQATRAIRAAPAAEHTRVLILTTFDGDEDLFASIHAGAAGYLLKDSTADALRAAVHTVAAGGNMLSPQITRRVMEYAARHPAPRRDPRLGQLTDRELDVLTRIGLGETNQEIATSLHLSPATARTYVSRILTKLDARDRTDLAVIAHRSGLDLPNRT